MDIARWSDTSFAIAVHSTVTIQSYNKICTEHKFIGNRGSRMVACMWEHFAFN